MAAELDNSATTGGTRRRLLRWGNFALQGAILGLVTWGMWGTIVQARQQLAAKGVSPWHVDYRWLALSVVCYLAGMFPCSLFWHRVMAALQQCVPRSDAVCAFFVSQLGKYVPGKFMVLVLRWALVRQYSVNRTLTVASIFIETLTMMSVGAMVGAVMLTFSLATDWRLLAFAIVVAAGVGAPTLPPVFLRLVKWTKLHRLHPEIDQTLAGLHWQILWPGWIAIALGWIAMGFSYWAVLQALPRNELVVQLPHLPQDLPILVACVALSTVLGFVSGLPGGIGARELVLIRLMKPQFGVTVAVLSAIVHRCVMMAAEVIAAAVLYTAVRVQQRRRQNRDEANRSADK